MRTLTPWHDENCLTADRCCSFRVRDVQGAEQSGFTRTEWKRSPEQPDPEGNARMWDSLELRPVRLAQLLRQFRKTSTFRGVVATHCNYW